MAELKQIFELVTSQIEPDLNAWMELEQTQRRSSRNRKIRAMAVAAAITAAVALFATGILNRGKEGSAPATVGPSGSGPAFTVVGLDGSILSSIPQLPEGSAMPDVSPDGTSVAFTIQDGPVSRIAVMRLDGTGFHIITHDPISAEWPRWSPDGSELLFYRTQQSSGLLRLMAMRADGTDVRWIRGTGELGDQPPDWSPDGSQVLYTDHSGSQRHLDTIPASGGHSERITTGVDVVGDGSWSPDGNTIAFKRLNGPLGILEPTSESKYEIWLMNADGTGRHLLAELPGRNAEAPEWSPDGSMIAFIGSDGGIGGGETGSEAVFVVDVATGDVTEVLKGIAVGSGHEGRATWLPDGDAVLVLTETP